MEQSAETIREANRLYWETEESVANIAAELELSRRALYDAVRPRPAGRNCPQCGSAMVYENRSGRHADNAVCQQCEGTAIAPSPESQTAVPPIERSELARYGAAALLGAVAGAALTLVVVRRK
jgi:hypothetical protein